VLNVHVMWFSMGFSNFLMSQFISFSILLYHFPSKQNVTNTAAFPLLYKMSFLVELCRYLPAIEFDRDPCTPWFFLYTFLPSRYTNLVGSIELHIRKKFACYKKTTCPHFVGSFKQAPSSYFSKFLFFSSKMAGKH
jgi:hypothetical protein